MPRRRSSARARERDQASCRQYPGLHRQWVMKPWAFLLDGGIAARLETIVGQRVERLLERFAPIGRYRPVVGIGAVDTAFVQRLEAIPLDDQHVEREPDREVRLDRRIEGH